jgi:hypothetical protein
MKGGYKGLSSRAAREKYLTGMQCERKGVLWRISMTYEEYKELWSRGANEVYNGCESLSSDTCRKVEL